MSTVFISLALGLATVGQVKSAAVDDGTIRFCIVQAIDDIEVPAKEPGVLTEVLVEEGHTVKVEQPLAQIDDLDARMAKDVAHSKFKSAQKQSQNEISVKAAEAQRQVYKAEWDVALDTNKQLTKTVSETEIRRLAYRTLNAALQTEQAKFDLTVAAIDAQAAEAEYKRAEALVDHRMISSPVDGIVAKVMRRKGNWVTPGDAVFRVVRMDRLRVHGHFDAKKYSQAKVFGKSVQIRVELAGGGSESLSGTIGFTSPVIDLNKGFEVWADVENKKDSQGNWILTPGMNADMTPQLN